MLPRPDRPTTETARYWRTHDAPWIEFFQARFHRHSYCRHTHDTFALGVIESGVQTFYYRGAQRVTPPLGIVAVNPGEVHDGQAFEPTGYRYRMIYVPPETVQSVARDMGGRGDLPFFDPPVIRNRRLARQFLQVHRAHDATGDAVGDALERQSRLLAFLAVLVGRHANGTATASTPARDDPRVRRAMAFMRAHLRDNVTLVDLAAEVGLSPYYFLRLFRSATSMPPHAWLCQRRVEAARDAIAAGRSLADAATDAGFYDQSHLTHRFRRTFGVTPAEYRRNLAGAAIRGEARSIRR